MAKSETATNVNRLLKTAGFLPIRKASSHTIWQCNTVSVSVPDGHTVISPGVMRKVTKAIREAK